MDGVVGRTDLLSELVRPGRPPARRRQLRKERAYTDIPTGTPVPGDQRDVPGRPASLARTLYAAASVFCLSLLLTANVPRHTDALADVAGQDNSWLGWGVWPAFLPPFLACGYAFVVSGFRRLQPLRQEWRSMAAGTLLGALACLALLYGSAWLFRT